MKSKFYPFKIFTLLFIVGICASILFSIISSDNYFISNQISLTAGKNNETLQDYKNALSLSKIRTDGLIEENKTLKALSLFTLIILFYFIVLSVKNETTNDVKSNK